MKAACRPWRRLFLLLSIFIAARAAAQSPSTTTVSDVVYEADGSPAQGTLLISWPGFATAAGQPVAAGNTNTTLGPGGSLSVALVPTQGATPANTVYTVVYQLKDLVKTEYWSVPTVSPATLAQVRVTLGASGSAAQMATQQYVNAVVAAKANDADVVHVAGNEGIAGVKQFSQSPNVPNPIQPLDVANKNYVDQLVQNVGGGSYLSLSGGTLTGPLTLSSDPTAPNQATTKHYSDLWAATKADIVAGLVPPSELGTGAPNASTCLLGNQSWGPCATGGGSSVYVNSSLVATPNFNNTSPSPQGNFLNCTFQSVNGNVSLECPYGNSAASFAIGSQAVFNNQANSYSSGLQDFSLGRLKLPSGTGFSPATNAEIGFDTSANMPVIKVSSVTQQIALTTSNISGQANTALALAGTPAQCNGAFATGIQANGNANCSAADVIQLAETSQPNGIPNYGVFWFDKTTHTPRIIDNNGQVAQLALMNVFNSDANTLEEYNSNNPQTLNVYGTRTDSSNYERLRLGYDTTDSYFVIGSDAAGTGVQRGIGFWMQGQLRWTLDSSFNLKPWSDNLKDIGAPTLRVHNLYLGTGLVFGSGSLTGVHGTTGTALEAGTVGTTAGASFCNDGNGNATDAGCPSGGSDGMSGMLAGQPMRASTTVTATSDAAWLFADDPAYTTGTNGDDCKAINNALLSPNNKSGQIDACGLTGVRACNSNPFEGYRYYATLKICGQFITSVPWSTPNQHHDVIAVNGPASPGVGGAGIYACANGVTTPGNANWDGTKCNPNGTAVPAFPDTSNPQTHAVIFHYPHYKFQAGTYYAVYYEGAQGTSWGEGWNHDGIGFGLRNITLDCGGISNCFAFYNQNIDIRNDYRNNQAEGLGASNSAGWFIDGAESPTQQAGPARFTMDQDNVNMQLAGTSSSAYGFVYEGAKTAITFTQGGCATMPAAHVMTITGSAITQIKVDNNGGSGCVNPTATAWGAPTSFGGTPISGATMTVTVTGGVVTAVTASGAGNTGYKGLTSTGPYAFSHLSVTNTTGTQGYGQIGVAIDGTINPNVDVAHAEWQQGYAVEIGGTQLVMGGKISAVDASANGNIGSALLLGPGADGQQLVSTIASGANNYIVDVNKSFTANATNCPNSDGVVTRYIPGTVIECGSGVQMLGNLSVAGSSTLQNVIINGTCSGSGCSGGSGMVYPAAGVANSTGTAWGTSYAVGTGANNLVQLNASAQLPAVSAANLTNFPMLNQNTTGTAANLSGAPLLPNGTTAATQSTSDNSGKLATTAFVQNTITPQEWITTTNGGANTTITMPTSPNQAVLIGVYLDHPVTTSKITYFVGNADNSANTYDLAIYTGSAGISDNRVLHVGPTAGSSFAPSTGAITQNWSEGATTLQPGRYYVLMTSSCTAGGTGCAEFGGPSVSPSFTVNKTFAISSGGTSPASITGPSDSYTGNWGISVIAH